jgi:membrane associated rhomboid family serine protease
MFLHDGFLHLFFNLFALWMFGGELERNWGGKVFSRFYLLAGLGAGLCITLANWLLVMRWPAFRSVPTVGASGAIYALLLAYGMLWPNREFYAVFSFSGQDQISGAGLWRH